MDHASRSVAEEDVDLVGFDNGCYLASSKSIVRHCLALAIFTHAVVWRSIFAGAHVYRGFDASGKSADGFACLAACFGDLALFGDGLDLVVLLKVACRTHHLDRIVDRVNFCFNCHICTYLPAASAK